MKVKKLFNVFMAATMGLACLPPVTASADSVGEGKVCGKAGIYFQNDQYTARDAVGGTWGPSSGDPAAVPFPVVGVSGGALGWDSNVEQSDTEICGDGTYTIFVSSHGTIDIWGRSTIEETAYPEQDGRISVTFTVKGLDAKTDLAKKSKVTVAKKKAYTGKALKPAVTVKVGSKTLKKGTDYTLSYKNNKKPGKATVTVKGKGNYTGKKTASFIIVPKKQAAPAVKALGNQKIKVTVKKDKLSSGYKVQYSTDKKFKKGVKTAAISKNSTTSKTIAKLTKGKTYYVRTAAYVKVGKKSYAGAYSKAKAIKVK